MNIESMCRNITRISHSTALASMILFVIISLLLVFLFLILLHLYVGKFLPQVLDDETNQTPRILLAGARVHLRRGFPINANNNDMNLRKGLESCEISTIPQFVFQEEKQEEGKWRSHGLECVICLSSFENGQLGRMLPSCNHAFHVECIDMWLYTHTTCPVCRASAVQVSSLPEDGVGPQESEQRPSYSREMSGEVSSRLEIIVELPSVENP